MDALSVYYGGYDALEAAFAARNATRNAARNAAFALAAESALSSEKRDSTRVVGNIEEYTIAGQPVMVYGHGEYNVPIRIFLAAGGCDTYDFTLSEGGTQEIRLRKTGEEDSVIAIPRLRRSSDVKHDCKQALVQMVAVNFQRDHAIVPILFFVNPDFTTPQACVERDSGGRHLRITNSEIRRAYKLCTDPTLSKQFKEIAKQSFVFFDTKTQTSSKGIQTFVVKKSPQPWENPEWETAWERRESTSKEKKKDRTWQDALFRAVPEARNLE